MKKILLLLVLIFPVCLHAQLFNRNVSKTGTVAATFLEIPVGASALGMGGAFVSVANDASALYWNAAGIAAQTQIEFMAQHTSWIAGTGFDFAALILPLSGIGTFGFSFTSLNMPDMKVTTVDMPQGTGEFFSAGDMAVGISYAMSLTDRFSIGFNVKYIQQSIWHETAQGFAVDFSTLFRTDLFNGLVIGAAISNFGTPMKLAGRDTRTFGRVDPTKLGSNERIPFDIEMDSWDLPLFMQLGVSTNVIKNQEIKWIVAADAMHPNDNYESVNVGTEVAYRDMVFLRGGFHQLFLKEKEGGLTLGIGVSSGNFFGQSGIRFDYAYRNFGRLENIHVFSIDLKF